jgi:hypothetical protein
MQNASRIDVCVQKSEKNMILVYWKPNSFFQFSLLLSLSFFLVWASADENHADLSPLQKVQKFVRHFERYILFNQLFFQFWQYKFQWLTKLNVFKHRGVFYKLSEYKCFVYYVISIDIYLYIISLTSPYLCLQKCLSV